MKRFYCVSMFLLMVHTTAAFADLYPVGFQWDPWADWTPRPPTDFLTTNGNPDDDQHGVPVYSYEYIMGLTSSNKLGSSSPWYTHSTGRMVWDTSWYGQSGGCWVYWDNSLPNASRGGGTSASYGTYVKRWINPCDYPIIVDYFIGRLWDPSGRPYVTFAANSDAMDLAVCLDHGTGPAGIELIYSTTFVTPPGYTFNQDNRFDPITLHNILVLPGESIFLTTLDYAGPWSGNVFAPAITLVGEAVAPIPAPGAILLGILGLGTAGWRLRKRGTP